MAQRYDLGDNSAYFEILPSDALSQIISLLDGFMLYRGWTKVATVSINATLQKYTYSAPNKNGSSKRLGVYISGASGSNGGTLKLAVSSLTDTLAPVGFNDAMATSTSPLFTTQWQTIRSASATHFLYCFANPQWCLFLARLSTGMSNPNAVSGAGQRTWTNGSSWRGARCNEFFPHTAWGWRDVRSYPKDGRVPAWYDFDGTLGTSEFVEMNDAVNSWTMTRFGAMGTVELMDSMLANPNMHIDLATALHQPDDLIPEQCHAAAILSSGVTTDIVYPCNSPEGGQARLCNLLSDVSDYGNAAFSDEAFKYPWNNKKIIQEAQFASKLGFLGSAFGLKITQASNNILEEVSLRVDENYRLSATGQLKRFIRVPGQFNYGGKYLRKYWTYYPGKVLTLRNRMVWSSLNETTGTVSPYWDTAKLDGFWTTQHDNFSYKNYSSFLIPA